MKKKYIVKESTVQGKGLFAVEPILKGDVVLVWNPRVVSKEEVGQLNDDERKHYIYQDGDKLLLMQSPERYVNHSCDPNTAVSNQRDVALRDIPAGEEITSDYIDKQEEKFDCNCGSEKCRFKH